MTQTSSASSKLLHGGLRYLENFEFRLVKEALAERQWWIEQNPYLAHPIKLCIPIFRNSHRSGWIYKMGLWLYDMLAGKFNIGKHQSLTREEIIQSYPELKTEGLFKGFSYYDVQMDEYRLGVWALNQALNEGDLSVYEHTISVTGQVTFYTEQDQQTQNFDKIIRGCPR
jgi:glycerol-3-phosphate dehydrogenase